MTSPSHQYTSYPVVPAGTPTPPSPPDSFSIPSAPASTPLSEAGGGGNQLDHPQLHEAINQAVMALEQWSSLCTHDHSGDPGGTPDIARGSRLIQANTHENADTDQYTTSLHHTLGSSVAGPGNNPYQASPANHNHNYNTLLNTPFQLCSSVSRPSNPPQGMMIYETDTNRARIWSAFANNSIASGLYSADYFTYVNPNGLGSNWSQSYGIPPTSGSNPSGCMATPDGSTCSWTGNSNSDNACVARRSNANDATTMTDDQVITWMTGTSLIQYELGMGYPSNDAYLRMDATETSYIRISVGYNFISIYYTTTGQAGEVRVLHYDLPLFQSTAIAGIIWTVTAQDRTITVQMNGDKVCQWNDAGAVSGKGSSNRGWGIGMHAAKAFLAGQLIPANIQYVTISDYIYYTTNNVWQIVPIANVPVCLLQQNKSQVYQPNGTAVAWDTEVEDSFGFWSPQAPSQILVTEPGVYHVSANITWPGLSTGLGVGAVVMKNGQKTPIVSQTQLPLSFNGATISVSGKLRLAQNDIIQIRSYSLSPFLSTVESWVDIDSKIMSTFELVFMSP